MVSHVETSSDTMFRHSTDSVKEQLEALCRRLQDELTTYVQDIYSLLARDYLHVLIGVDKDPKPTGLPRAERLLRAEMYHKLEQTAKRFARPNQDASAIPANTPGGDEGDDPFADSAIADMDDLLLAQLCGSTVESVGGQGAVKSEPSA